MSNVIKLPTTSSVVPVSSVIDLAGFENFQIGREIDQGGLLGYEPEVFAALAALIEVAGPSARFLDIGANIGVFSLTMKAIYGDRVAVTAFEPVPTLVDFIQTTALRNQLSIDVLTCALSDNDGVSSFYLSNKSDASNSLNRHFRPHKGVIDVTTARLDTLLQDAEGSLILKIDTESTEPDVLAGAAEVIAKHRPPIVCEVLAGRTEERLQAFFGAIGYRAIHLTATPNWAGEEKLVGDPGYTYRDWLFVGEAPTEALQNAHHRWLEAIRAAQAGE